MSRLSELVSKFRTSHSSSQQQVVLAVRIVEFVIKNQKSQRIPPLEIKAATECIDALRKKHPAIGHELWIYWTRRTTLMQSSNANDASLKSILKRLRMIRVAWTRESRLFSAG